MTLFKATLERQIVKASRSKHRIYDLPNEGALFPLGSWPSSSALSQHSVSLFTRFRIYFVSAAPKIVFSSTNVLVFDNGPCVAGILDKVLVISGLAVVLRPGSTAFDTNIKALSVLHRCCVSTQCHESDGFVQPLNYIPLEDCLAVLPCLYYVDQYRQLL